MAFSELDGHAHTLAHQLLISASLVQVARNCQLSEQHHNNLAYNDAIGKIWPAPE
jgi:hypothetical protein